MYLSYESKKPNASCPIPQASVLAELLGRSDLPAKARSVVQLIQEHRKASESASCLEGLVRLAGAAELAGSELPFLKLLRASWYQMGTPTGTEVTCDENKGGKVGVLSCKSAACGERVAWQSASCSKHSYN